MRTVPMCSSMLQVPTCRIHSLANFWREGFHGIDRTYGNHCSFRLFASKANGIEGVYRKRWIRGPVSTETKGRSETTQSSVFNIRGKILDNKVSGSTASNVNDIEATEFQKIQKCDIRQKIAEDKNLADNVTVIVFDSETTGFGRDAQIIDIAFQDLKGGENSTFQSLVNPGRHVPNSHIHNITTRMVCRPEVPRMGELIPILLQFIRSRQKPGGYVVLVAHNARCFDVPILTKEFSRCSIDIPYNWLFLDTLPLAREVFKAEGSKAPASLEALSRKYNVKYEGQAHRALTDVKVLSSVFRMLTIDLKLTLPLLISKSFSPSDLTNSKKKNNSS